MMWLTSLTDTLLLPSMVYIHAA